MGNVVNSELASAAKCTRIRSDCHELDQTTERVAGDVGTLDAEVVEHDLQLVADGVLDRHGAVDPRAGLPVTGQVDEDHVEALRELVEDRVPRLASVPDAVDQQEGLAAPVSFMCQQRQLPFRMVVHVVSLSSPWYNVFRYISVATVTQEGQ